MLTSVHGAIDYDECGVGPTVVLVPGSCSNGAAWRPVTSCWNNRFRCITTSLLGYGGTAECRSSLDADISHEAEVVEAVVRRAGCPVHLVGHSLGGLVALAVALGNRVPLLSLVIIEAPLPGMLRCQGELRHYRAFREMTDAYVAAYRRGDNSAIRSVIDFYGGPGTFAGLPQRVRDYVVGTTAVNMLDWQGAYGFQPGAAALAGIDVPVLVIRGEGSHPAVKHANWLLARQLPKASLVTIADASHFMIATHAEELARLIAEQVLEMAPAEVD
jgi:pimeloyl-ACP methyl ester carboxylesterase